MEFSLKFLMNCSTEPGRFVRNRLETTYKKVFYETQKIHGWFLGCYQYFFVIRLHDPFKTIAIPWDFSGIPLEGDWTMASSGEGG